MAQVADSLDQGAQRFHFDALVRGLCNSSEMREHLHAKMLELHQKQTNAPAVLAALTQSLDQQPLLDKTNTTLRLVFHKHEFCKFLSFLAVTRELYAQLDKYKFQHCENIYPCNSSV